MNPLISVVVPTYRRNALLARCLAALFAQEYPPDGYEIVVVDDAGDEATRRLVDVRARLARPRLRYLCNDGRRGPAAARNLGWRAAAGSIIAFTDDDCVPDRQWLAQGGQGLKGRVAAAWGRLVMPLPPEPTDFQRDAAGLEQAGFVTANCFCRREALEAVGGFDERFETAWREDSDLYFTLLERGFEVEYVDGAIVTHPVRQAPWGVSLKQQRKNLYNALLYKKHRALYRDRIQRAAPWHYYASVVALAALATGAMLQAVWLPLACAGLWLAMTWRFCRQRLRHTSRSWRHVAEMVVTSALIPPLAIFWRVCGAIRYRVLFL